MTRANRTFLILTDALLVLSALWLALIIRYEGTPPQRYLMGREWFFALVVLESLLVFQLFGLYSKYWRYAGVNELVNITIAVTISALPPTILILAWQGMLYPRWSSFIYWMLTLMLVGGVRFLLRLVSERHRGPVRGGSRTLVVGANDIGAMTVRELQRRPALGMQAVGLVDDDPGKHGLRIHGVQVLGTADQIPSLVESENIEEVVIALPSPSLVKRVVEISRPTRVRIKVVPSISEIIDGSVAVSQIRKVQIEDLLEREPVNLDVDTVAAYLKGKRVLVTGAGGSIGSEICRQVCRFEPGLLLLMGHGENSIYEIALELEKTTSVPLLRSIADIRDRERLEAIFQQHHPQVVFHAAAHKHVPLMEENPPEAVSNNVFGTLNLVELAREYAVERLVFLSTDKAVNPTSIMGATKQLAELVLRSRAEGIVDDLAPGRAFVAVRFGNVLDSRGSVIPTFRRQIEMGGPVTVTHPDVTRFFMTIPEAVQLVIQAGALGGNGSVYILNMGKAIHILDLARNMIRLSGLEPDQDIEIRFTGMRPGEKMEEELINTGEEAISTASGKILKIRPARLDADKLEQGLGQLREMTRSGDVQGIHRILKELVPNYITPGPDPRFR